MLKCIISPLASLPKDVCIHEASVSRRNMALFHLLCCFVH